MFLVGFLSMLQTHFLPQIRAGITDSLSMFSPCMIARLNGFIFDRSAKIMRSAPSTLVS